MGKFVRSIVIKEDFEGETATITCRPMTRMEALKLQKIEDEDFGGMVALLDPAIEKFEGLTDAAGAVITREDFLGNAYFLPLLAKVSAKWSEASVPSKEK